MKLVNITEGPLSLTSIDYSPRLSHETTAFGAKVSFKKADGTILKGEVENDGHGGSCMVHPRELEAEIEKYARTLPHEKSDYSDDTFAQSGDYVIARLIDEAIAKTEDQKAKKKGFTHVAVIPRGVVYLRGVPSAEYMVDLKKKFRTDSLVVRAL